MTETAFGPVKGANTVWWLFGVVNVSDPPPAALIRSVTELFRVMKPLFSPMTNSEPPALR